MRVMILISSHFAIDARSSWKLRLRYVQVHPARAIIRSYQIKRPDPCEQTVTHDRIRTKNVPLSMSRKVPSDTLLLPDITTRLDIRPRVTRHYFSRLIERA